MSSTVHEWGLVADAARQVECGADGHRLASVTLAIGSGADEMTVRTAWASLTAGGALESADLVIEHRQDRLSCLECGLGYHGRSPLACPGCGGDGLVTAAVADLTLQAWVALSPAAVSSGAARSVLRPAGVARAVLHPEVLRHPGPGAVVPAGEGPPCA